MNPPNATLAKPQELSNPDKVTVGILLSIAALAAEGMGVVPALPSAVRALDGLRLLGVVFSSFMLAWLFGTVVAGQLADSYGPRRPMAIGLLGFGFGLLCSATAQQMVQFLIGRILQGASGGFILAAAFVTIARGYPESKRPRMIALTSTVWILPAVVGPSLSGWVVEHVGWRLVFAGVLPILAIAALLVVPPLGSLSIRKQWITSVRLPAAMRLAIGMGLFIYSLSQVAQQFLWASCGIGVGLCLIVPTLRTLLPEGTLRGQPVLPLGVLSRGLLGFAFFGTEAFIPIASGELRGASPMRAGLALSVAALGWTAASWAIERARHSAHPLRQRMNFVEAGFAFQLVGIAGVLATLLSNIHFLGIPFGWALSGLGMGLGHSAASLLCIASAPKGQEGTVSAQLQLCEALGIALGTGLGGAIRTVLMDHGSTAREATTATFAMTMTAAILGVFLFHRGKSDDSVRSSSHGR